MKRFGKIEKFPRSFFPFFSNLIKLDYKKWGISRLLAPTKCAAFDAIRTVLCAVSHLIVFMNKDYIKLENFLNFHIVNWISSASDNLSSSLKDQLSRHSSSFSSSSRRQKPRISRYSKSARANHRKRKSLGKCWKYFFLGFLFIGLSKEPCLSLPEVDFRATSGDESSRKLMLILSGVRTVGKTCCCELILLCMDESRQFSLKSFNVRSHKRKYAFRINFSELCLNRCVRFRFQVIA